MNTSELEKLNEEDDKILKKHVLLLNEHFDSVQIFATRHISNELGTVRAAYGSGNFFARVGQIGLWLDRQSELNDSDEDEE
jgi:hypothetical protein